MTRALGPAIGWYDPETGKTHSLDHYKPEHANHLDEHKAGWRLAYAPEPMTTSVHVEISVADRALAADISKVRKLLPLVGQP